MCPIPVNYKDEGYVPPSPLPHDVPSGLISPIQPPIQPIAPRQPVTVMVEEPMPRGRSRSRSRSPSHSRSLSPSVYGYRPPSRSSRSPSPRPIRRRSYRRRSRTPSPLRPLYCYQPPLPIPTDNIYIPPVPSSPPSPMPYSAPVPMPCMAPPPPLAPPIMVHPPTMNDPVDILTFCYNKNMAYAPAASTYEEAIDIVLELWPELQDFGRDRVNLLVGGSDQLVRVPRVAWQLVLCDLSRYEVVQVQVDQPAPPPQYKSKGRGKGIWGSKDGKDQKSNGLFTSIKRIFWR